MTKKVIETTNGWYMENEKEKVELEDIIGLVKTDEPTDSVQLKKEVQLSICEKRIIELENENEKLKQQLSEAKADEKQLGISFMGYKMKLIEVLQKKYDKVKGKTLYADVYTEIAEEMGVDLE